MDLPEILVKIAILYLVFTVVIGVYFLIFFVIIPDIKASKEKRFFQEFKVEPLAREDDFRKAVGHRFLGEKHKLASILIKINRAKIRSTGTESDKREIEELIKSELKRLLEINRMVRFAAEFRPQIVEDLVIEMGMVEFLGDPRLDDLEREGVKNFVLV